MLNYESLERKPIQKLNSLRNNEVDKWTMVSKFNDVKYKDTKNQIGYSKREKQNEIDNLLFEENYKKFNNEDFYHCLEKETLLKIRQNNIIKGKTLKGKLLDNQPIRKSFEQSNKFCKL